jgi:hypothetical protein
MNMPTNARRNAAKAAAKLNWGGPSDACMVTSTFRHFSGDEPEIVLMQVCLRHVIQCNCVVDISRD